MQIELTDAEVETIIKALGIAYDEAGWEEFDQVSISLIEKTGKL